MSGKAINFFASFSPGGYRYERLLPLLLKVSNSSVTGALRSLADKELIKYAPYDVISLTPTGKTAAKDVVCRHEVLRDFFLKVLAVEEQDADKAACQMEHSIPNLEI